MDGFWEGGRFVLRSTIEARQQTQDKEIIALRAENRRLHQVCRDAYEVWAGSEGIPVPVTCPEAYLLQLLEQMRDEVKKGL